MAMKHVEKDRGGSAAGTSVEKGCEQGKDVFYSYIQ